MNPLALAAALWGILAALAVALLALRARTMGLLNAAGWIIVVATVLAAGEDAALATWYALAPPGVDPDGALGVVHEHARGHMLGAGAWAFVAAGLCIAIALGPLRRGERWAWWALLAALVAGGGVDLYELLAIYPHGFAGGAGFGWPPLVVYVAAWAGALAMAAPEALGRQAETPAV